MPFITLERDEVGNEYDHKINLFPIERDKVLGFIMIMTKFMMVMMRFMRIITRFMMIMTIKVIVLYTI